MVKSEKPLSSSTADSNFESFAFSYSPEVITRLAENMNKLNRRPSPPPQPAPPVNRTSAAKKKTVLKPPTAPKQPWGYGGKKKTLPNPQPGNLILGKKKMTSLKHPPLAPPSSSSKTPESSYFKFITRPGFGTMGDKCLVQANHYPVTVGSKKSYFHYDVSITPELTSKAMNRRIIEELIRLNKRLHLGNLMPAYDGKKGLYTAGKLPFDSKEFNIIILVDPDFNTNDVFSSCFERKGREMQFNVTIRYAAKLDVDHLQRFLEGKQPYCPQEIIQALDVVLRTLPSTKYTVVGRSFFSPEKFGHDDLGDGLISYRGYYQSLCATQDGFSLNIDESAASFYDSIDVIAFILKNFNLECFSLPLQDHDCVKFERALKGIKVKTKHLQNSRSYKITGLSSQPVYKTMFSLGQQQTQISVFEYFRHKYNIVLKYPALPALQAGTDARPIYLPMELCKIVAGQKYNKKLNEKQVTMLLEATCRHPNERKTNINDFVQKAFGGSNVEKEFGISVGTDPVVIDARVLRPPPLLYSRGSDVTATPSRVEARWCITNRSLYEPRTVDSWACMCFSREINLHTAREFCQRLLRICIRKGMAFKQDPTIPIRRYDPEYIEDGLARVHKESSEALAREIYFPFISKQIQLLIIILPDMMRSGSYGEIKRVCETKLGIVSQCCQPSTVSLCCKESNSFIHLDPRLENLALKINVKMGGRNSVLMDALLRRIPVAVADAVTVIFGADVTHPQPGDDKSPSMAAVVGCTDWPLISKYQSVVSAQGHRDEIIRGLYKPVPDETGQVSDKGMIRELLLSFERSTKQKPKRIIFYRDGVSDGQLKTVLHYEMDAIRKACEALEEGYHPTVTYVVVQKRHKTRFFSEVEQEIEDGQAIMQRSGNVLPGTVVDTKICHRVRFDFYLNSHPSIKGTSRPAHYYVLFDENNFSADDMHTFTYYLCFIYARCTHSVSVVAPVYYAHLAAKRARHYIDEEEKGDGESSCSSDQVRPLLAIKDTLKDVMLYC